MLPSLGNYTCNHSGPRNAHFQDANAYCTTPNKILAIWLVKSARRRVKKCWMSHAPGMRHPPWLSHASDVITINVTITALRIIVDLRDLLAHRNGFVNEIRVTLWSHARWLYLATEGENTICPARTAKVKSSWTVFAFLCSTSFKFETLQSDS